MPNDKVHNPFADFGNIVYGEQFVGRQDAIRTIQQRVINSPKPGCLAIVGAPRIGKSSLAYHALIHPRQSLIEHQLLTFWIYLPDFSNHEELFRELVRQTLNALDDADSEDEAVLLRGRRLLEKHLSWLDLQNEVRQFFKKVKGSGWCVVSVIDEFDEARHIFQDGIGFQALRELANQPQWSVGLVTVSRRSLSEIANQSGADISNLPGIFKDETLRCFSREELGKLLGKLKTIELEVNNDIFDFIWSNTGGHPHLASGLAFEFSKEWLHSRQCNLEKALRNSTPEFLKYYDNLVDLLKEDGSLKKLLEILFGPVITATRFDAERLARYGLIQPNADGYYNAFSSHFEDYLRLVERSVDLWPLWRDTEKRLRTVITQIMQVEYETDHWVSKLESDRPELKAMLDECRKLQKREKKIFGERASVNLLDFMYSRGLFQIIKSHWSSFEPILGKDKHYWEDCSQLLLKLRNRMAHSRDETIQPHERQKAEAYCREILYLLDKSQNLET